MGGTQKIKHASPSVMKSWDIPNAALVVIRYDRQREMKWLIATPNAHWSFLSLSDTLRLVGWAVNGPMLYSLTYTLSGAWEVAWLCSLNACTFYDLHVRFIHISHVLFIKTGMWFVFYKLLACQFVVHVPVLLKRAHEIGNVHAFLKVINTLHIYITFRAP